MKTHASFVRWHVSAIGVIIVFVLLVGCSTGPLPGGLIYTRVRHPYTPDLNKTPLPENVPNDAKIIEVREPFTNLNVNVKVKSNAIGELAKANGLKKLYFADRETFSILGIWTSTKIILYGE